MENKIILSFDYELFFGDKSGTVQRSLIEPTYRLLNVMDSVGFKGNFFVDWQMLKYLKQEKDTRCQEDYTLIVQQLKDMVKGGHRIELHIHPHWVDAKYNGDGSWDFSNFKHYCLNSFTKEEIDRLFREGIETLTAIAREVNPKYKIVAFRAGGWAVQPFELLKDAFKENGILLDSSIMAGFGIETMHSKCNFTEVVTPTAGYYRFEDDVCKEELDGSFIEIPISSCKRGLLVKIVSKLSRLLRADFSAVTDGTHNRENDSPDVWINPQCRGIFTFSNIHPVEVILRQISNSEIQYTCYIDHPKDLSRYTLRGIKLLSRIRKSALYCDIIKEVSRV